MTEIAAPPQPAATEQGGETTGSAASTQSPAPAGMSAIAQAYHAYSGGQQPLPQYAVMSGLYTAAFAVFLALSRTTGRPIPERIAWQDILLVGLATHKLSRVITKELVTSHVRAPFTTFQGLAGEGEVSEKPRGEGMQRVLGEWMTCPFCMAPWVAAALAYAMVLQPRMARFVAGVFTAVTISDFLQGIYVATHKVAE